MTKLQQLRNAVGDSVADLLYYDRKNSELTIEDVKQLAQSGQLTPELLIAWYTVAITEAFSRAKPGTGS